ncbi:MAG: N-6 DNA methylase [Candidatus Dadabacteria bacterium]|nr:N-6 DNA methylase [Candidatus Dadabacteria bacterium]
MHTLNLKPTHKALKSYYKGLEDYNTLNVNYEEAVKVPFQHLLEHCSRQFKWIVQPGYKIHHRNNSYISVDAALIDEFNLTHGFWEAKDTDDDLVKEIKKKFAKGYPKDNILFQQPDRAILFQNGEEVLDKDITNPSNLIEILKQFFEYAPPGIWDWKEAVLEFQERVPELAAGLIKLIEEQRKTNRGFVEAFSNFMSLCRQSLNPNLSENAVEEMLIQHLLTERIFRRVFNNPDFARRNVIAVEIEKVIDALTSQAFSRKDFLGNLDRFYVAIENAAETIEDFSTKQTFLNTVYEKFFQGFSVKMADTLGIIYTPQPIVDFMINSVEDILEREFGKTLSDSGVHILDPFVGTGNFIVNIMRRISPTRLEEKYKNELHCNEVMLLPYYIASMNIEHEYFERMGNYLPFEGICLVDTFELAEPVVQRKFGFMTPKNTERVERQKQAPIFVIIANPPYNMGQINENDNNKNRQYETIDKRVTDTYAADSKAQLLNKLQDPYVKAIRWATDRIGNEGIVAYVTNNSFLDNIAFDGMRRHLGEDFSRIYVLDLGGNVRKNPKLSGTTHNVFGIQVGVSINLFVMKNDANKPDEDTIYYSRVGESWRKEEKYKYLEKSGNYVHVDWQTIEPDKNHTWLTEGLQSDFDDLVPLGTKEAKKGKDLNAETIFKMFSLGVSTNRDRVVYGFDRVCLSENVKHFCADYNAEVVRYQYEGKDKNLDDFLNYEKVKWSENLKRDLRNSRKLNFDDSLIRISQYRPFNKLFLYFSKTAIDRLSHMKRIFPTPESEEENMIICVPSIGARTDFWCFFSKIIPNLTLTSLDGTQCFPFYIYDKDGSNCRENITDWALDGFRSQYEDKSISKWDIFHYTYAMLHHPGYRERYAANLRRALPRIPFAPVFWTFAEAGQKLADLHVNYEDQPEYDLDEIVNRDVKFTWRVEKMKLNKEKTHLIYNDCLTLGPIPEKAFEYRLGNRSALDWVIEQYRVKTDKRSGITDDPNNVEDEQYIYKLIKKVIAVSLETVDIVNPLHKLDIFPN